MKNVITISRQMGSGGRMIADMISQRLGWPLVGKELVTEAARKAGVDEIKIQRIFEHRLSLQDRITFQQRSAKYLDAISNVIHEFSDKGEVVLLGRASNLVLAGDPRIFRVNLVAEFEVRIERIAEQLKLRGKKGLEKARQLVVDSDYARSAYHTYLFDVDWNDPMNYDLILNTTELTLDEAADAIHSVFEVIRGRLFMKADGKRP